jgi:hypothetical protein
MFLIAYRFVLYYNLPAMNPYREVKNLKQLFHKSGPGMGKQKTSVE